jgi:hypothetical protein
MQLTILKPCPLGLGAPNYCGPRHTLPAAVDVEPMDSPPPAHIRIAGRADRDVTMLTASDHAVTFVLGWCEHGPPADDRACVWHNKQLVGASACRRQCQSGEESAFAWESAHGASPTNLVG